jgi:hypothetical protein
MTALDTFGHSGRTEAMLNVEDIEYGADGSMMVGRLAHPDGDGPRPAVLR